VIVNPLETISLPAGSDTILVNGDKVAVSGNSYTASYDSLVNRSSVFAGNTPIRQGFRVQILNNNVVQLDTATSGLSGTVTPISSYAFSVLTDGQFPVNNGVKRANDYLIEFSNSIVDTSVEMKLFPTNKPSNFFPAVPVNFRLKNVSENKYIDFFYRVSGTISTTYSIYFREQVGDTTYNTWRVDIAYKIANQPLETSGQLALNTLKPFSSADYLTFKMKGPEINKQAASNEMDRIKVVPNPYVVTHEAEASLLSTQTSGRGEREIRFTHVPPGSAIYIYTVRGELIKTLRHDNLFVGDVYWNLRTEENLDVAYGVYVYLVETPGIGKKIGKLALIK